MATVYKLNTTATVPKEATEIIVKKVFFKSKYYRSKIIDRRFLKKVMVFLVF